MSFKISCPNPDCQTPFLVQEHQVGKHFRCRKCRQIAKIPSAPQANSEITTGHAMHQREIAATPRVAAGPGRCPSCKAQLQANAVLCVSCGYNLQTGEKLATVRERKAKITIWPSAVLGLSVACYIGGAILVVLGFVIHPILAFLGAVLAAGIALLGFF